MARIANSGISYYPIDSDHIFNTKIKLLFNEFDSHGYWIYQCVLSFIYRNKGYYMDLNDPDQLVLFASDVCKKPVSLVKEVITGCIRRGLFDKSVFDSFNVLTSDRIQENYLAAKKALREKGYITEIIQAYLLISLPKNDAKIQLISLKNNSSIEELNNSTEELDYYMEESPQIRVKEIRVEKNKEKERKKNTFKPPLLEEVISYFKENGYSESAAIRAFNGYDVAGWMDSHGNQIKNWKQKMIHVWFTDKNKTRQIQNGGLVY